MSDDIQVVDADAHLVEPPDLWTSRLGSKWNSDVLPHVRRDPETGEDAWWIGGQRELTPGFVAMAGFDKYYPDHPATFDDFAEAAILDADARLRRLDEFGVYSQILYPNAGGFGSGAFLRIPDSSLRLECVKAYNDYATEWCSADSKRLIPMACIPFWDLENSLRETKRAVAMGHRGIIMTSLPEQFGEPGLSEPHWDPLWALAQDMDIPVNFHVGSGDRGHRADNDGSIQKGLHATMAKRSTLVFLGNANAVAELIFGGICHRFPQLRFVSVESGVGWMPYLLESMDWQWLNGGVPQEHPEYDLLPSEYFRRQIYGTFWFEKGITKEAIEALGEDHIMYETDYPHPTSQSPGPASVAQVPKDYIAEFYGHLDRALLRKLLHDNAATVYGL